MLISARRDQGPRTSYCANRAASAVVIHDGSITFDSAIHREIAAESCIRDLFVLQYSNSYFDSFDGTCAVVQEAHGGLGSTG